MAHDNYGGLEDGILHKLPLMHAPSIIIHDEKPTKGRFGYETQQSTGHWIKPPPAKDSINSPSHPRRRNQRPHRNGNQLNWAIGGPGMRAVFLGSNQRSCGTGVFLPRTGTDLQFTNNPACAPVLLPSRVVQTLNLNVHELGLHIKPNPDKPRNITRKIDANLENNNKIDGAYYSPEIFLPKEWTY